MQLSSTFTVARFTPVEPAADDAPGVEVGLAVGHATMEKTFEGDLEGRSTTQFSYVHGDGLGGTYVATEAFEGTVADREGAFAFVHSATDVPPSEPGGPHRRAHEFFLVVPHSGTRGLAGISGTGALWVDDDGTHRLRLDVELPDLG